ncbi:MAG: hypothetical protein LBD97_10455 [Bifidobacteriaceae bacterium]|nr:hypothetical protein [Bifidobacteriaceae bacterium]
MKTNVVRRLVAAALYSLLVAAVSSASAGAVGANYLDADLAREFAATQGQGEFSEFLGTALGEFPNDVVDFSWHGDHGIIVVAPRVAAEVEELASSHPANVTVVKSTAQAIPYLDRSTAELAVLDALEQAEAPATAARYDPATGSVVLTVWGDSESVAPEDLGAAEIQPGVPIAVDYEDPDDPPREDASHERW